MTPPQPNHDPSSMPEPNSFAAWWVAAVGLGLLGLIAVVLLGLATGLQLLLPDTGLVDAQTEWNRAESSPGVMPNQAYARRAYQTRWNERLQSYGWQDDQHSIAHVPIDRAMEMMVDQEFQVSWGESDMEDTERE